MLTRTHLPAALASALLLALVVSPACRARGEAPRVSDAPIEVKPTSAEPMRAEVGPPIPPAADAPKTCTLAIHFFEASGRPRLDGGSVELADGSTAPLVDGIARFENMLVGMEVQAVQIDGPGLGEPLHCLGGTIDECVFRYSATWGNWVGVRIVDHDGTPAASRRFEYFVQEVPRSRVVRYQRLSANRLTRGDGVVWFQSPRQRWRASDREYEHVLRFDDRELVVLDIERDFPRGETLLPDVHLRSSPDLVAGRVLYADRSPSDTFRVWVEHRADAAADWQRTNGLEVYRDSDDGAFCITGAAPAGDTRVCVQDGRSPRVEYLPFRPGQRDIEFAFDP